MKKYALLGVVLVLLLAPPLGSVTTAIWKVSTPDDYGKGTFEDTILSSAGEVSLGLELARLGSEEVAATCCAVDGGGAVYLGTGNRGRILRVTGDKLELYAQTEGMYIASLAVNQAGELFAGSLYEGNIYKIAAGGAVSGLCQLPDKYVWALAIAADGTLYAGTGPEGKLFAVAPDGKFELLHDSKEDHILSLALDGAGNVFFGTYSNGLLCKYAKGKGVEVVCDLDEQEIRALVFAGQDLYIGANKVKKFDPAKFVKDLKKAAEKKAEGEESEAKMSDRYDGSVYRFSPNGGFSILFSMAKTCLYDVKVDKNGAVYIATGDEGKIYKVLPDGTTFVLCDLKEQQGMCLQLVNSELKYVCTGNTGALYSVTAATPAKGAYISEVKDTKFRSRWGNMSWSAKGKLTMQTRSGNTAVPDETWSQWSEAVAESPAPVASPPARYLQFRVNWDADKAAVLSWVMIAFVMDNQQPRVTELTVEGFDEAGPFQGKPREGTEFTAKWKAEDPDGDSLVFRVYARRTVEEDWLLLSKEATAKKDFKWDTSFLADGWYEIRLVASDEKANPPDATLTASRVMKPVLIDNRKASIVTLAVAKTLECTGLVEDSFSNVARIEYAVDGGEWAYVYPADNVYDQRTEAFKFMMSGLKRGTHYVHVRAFDAAGNVSARQEQFLVE
ncbi:MAG: hypothetical protein RDV41_14365 [Planctomycetota bacterium]|nr:hypothetical protein [Planctomycetota bacterium]